jgi:hypothetical protein
MNNATSADNISALWERSAGSPDEEWTYWQTFAAICLSDAKIAAILEKSSIPELTSSDDVKLSVIERLLLEQICSYVLNPWVKIDADGYIEGRRNLTVHSVYDISAGSSICQHFG